MVVLLYFDETQNVNVLLINVRWLTRTGQNDYPGFTLHFAFCQSKATEPIITTNAFPLYCNMLCIDSVFGCYIFCIRSKVYDA